MTRAAIQGEADETVRDGLAPPIRPSGGYCWADFQRPKMVPSGSEIHAK